MGFAINKDRFDESEYQQFDQRLDQNLEALAMLLRREEFGQGDHTLGAELELDLIDKNSRPLALNRRIMRLHVDPQLQLELTRFNLEYNLLPVDPAGRPFGQLQQQLETALSSLQETVANHGGRILAIGILPTLRSEDLASDALTNLPRYRALSNGLKRIRRGPFTVKIDGDEPLKATCDDVTLEGANTSFQVHLRVNPQDFAAMFNAAQLVTPLAVAVSGNSPIFLEHCLWEETRVALFKQAVDARTPDTAQWRRAARVPYGHGWVRRGAYELFAEFVRLYPPILPICNDENSVAVARDGGIPTLSELRVQQSTVWQWNRPVYDPSAGGHLRIEFRTLPSGPTPIDMMANAAFLVGATIGMSQSVERVLPAFPFRYAEYNFYRASQSGLSAGLLWPTAKGVSPRETDAATLVHDFLPLAREGLTTLGVAEAEIDTLLGIIADRARSGRTAARWQRKTLEICSKSGNRREALAEMVNAYHALSTSGRPVHEWPAHR